MKGRDIIIHILENHLEDEEVLFNNSDTVKFYSIEEIAIKSRVGIETIKTLISLNKIAYVKIGDLYFIPA